MRRQFYRASASLSIEGMPCNPRDPTQDGRPHGRAPMGESTHKQPVGGAPYRPNRPESQGNAAVTLRERPTGNPLWPDLSTRAPLCRQLGPPRSQLASLAPRRSAERTGQFSTTYQSRPAWAWRSQHRLEALERTGSGQQVRLPISRQPGRRSLPVEIDAAAALPLAGPGAPRPDA
jgi:hypothetical protein